MAAAQSQNNKVAHFIEPGAKQVATARRLGRALALPQILAQALVRRAITDEAPARAFLRPRLSQLLSPESMADFSAAVERVTAAIEQKQTVGVFGDYDVDGITAAAVVSLTLQELGCPPYVRIAHRNHGYGLQPDDVADFCTHHCDLLIACDVGSSDVEALELAQKRGLDVVVLDHHKLPEQYPPAVALVNPSRPDCDFPDTHMASVGLAFYLAAGLKTHLAARAHRRPLPDPRIFLDLVALGTVADVAPLVGPNRIMVSRGLQLLGGNRRPGLQALARISGLNGSRGAVGVREVAFRLAPRLNAAGRLGDAMPAYRLLQEEDPVRARKLAADLEEMNRTRQKLQDTVLEAARQQVEWGEAGENVLVVDGPGWHPGVVGIVAAKLAEQYDRPALVISIGEDGEGRGSARTAGGVNLYECLERARRALVSFGGHEAAAGLVVRREKIEQLRSLLEAAVAAGRPTPLDHTPQVEVDGRLTLAQVDAALMGHLDKLEPVGSGNPPPAFVTYGVGVDRMRVVGRGHLALQLAAPQSTLVRSAIGFSMARRQVREGQLLDVAFTPEWDTYHGAGAIRLKLIDLRESRKGTSQAPSAEGPQARPEGGQR
jgi:single-stranded-DNA-specific exonuclease